MSRTSGRCGVLKGLVAAAAVSLACAASAGATTITVDTDDDDGTAGDCELREALDAAATDTMQDTCPAGQPAPTRDVIQFDIGLDDSIQTITLSLAEGNLPPVNNGPLEIDGRNGAAMTASFPRVEIDATNAPGAGLVLSVGADGSFVHHLAVYDAQSDGIRIQNDDNLLSNLVVGIDLAGVDHGNASDGIEVRGADNTIASSVISGNAGNGIGIADDNQFSPTTGTTITGNKIGTGPGGTAGEDNDTDGIAITGGNTGVVDDTVIGGTTDPTPGGVCDGDCNLISGNGDDGIDVRGPGSAAVQGLVIRGNHVGTNAAGSGAVANGDEGVTIGGAVAGAITRSNLISGNTDNGLQVSGSGGGSETVGPNGMTVAGNVIGVNRAGVAALANGGAGIDWESTLAPPDDQPITNNTIGGTADPTPGGACDGDCNLVSGNLGNGILLLGKVDGTQVLGNYVGTDLAGTTALANGQDGVVLSKVTNTTLGSPAAPNLISGNAQNGVELIDKDSAGNVVQSNRIGLSANNVPALGNGQNGVFATVGAAGTTVGGTAAGTGNTIANNALSGVRVNGGGPPFPSIPVIGNSIRDNGDLGIDLMPNGLITGVTANDGLGDPDTGGNGLQNFPVLTAVAALGGSTFVVGSLDSTASTTYRIEVYSNGAADPSGNGEGAQLDGSFQVTTDATGHAAFVNETPGTTAFTRLATATATEIDGSGNPVRTSEFATTIPEGCDFVGTGADDDLTGTAADEVLCGFAGDDTITGGGGDDVIIGGGGTDTTSYAGAGAGVTVDLQTGTATGGAGSDIVREVESAVGSDFADQLTAVAGGSGLIGQGGADTLTGGAGADTLEGDEGNDTLTGAEGDDTLTSGGGDDAAAGGSGNDSLFGAGGNDSLTGDGGNDRVDGDDGDDTLLGSAGADTVSGYGGADTGSGGDGNDSLFGAAGNDSLTGDGGNDTVDGDDGNDALTGSAGADQVLGRGGDDVETGGDGDDTVAGYGGNDAGDGGAGNDTMTGDDGDDALTGVDGDDTVAGGTGRDSADGGAGIDQLSGDDGDDTLIGGGGADNLLGGAGVDTASGGDDNDTVDGGTGSASTLDGGAGNDNVTGAEGADDIDGGDGDDTLNGLDGDDALDGGIGNDTLDGGSGNDGADGDDGDDTIFGQSGDDDVTGGAGDDTVKSHGGRDEAEGGGGDDTVTAGGGDKDEARGQGGKDTVKGGGGDKDDVRGGGGKDKLEGGGGKKDECDGGGGKDEKPAPGCEIENSIP